MSILPSSVSVEYTVVVVLCTLHIRVHRYVSLFLKLIRFRKTQVRNKSCINRNKFVVIVWSDRYAVNGTESDNFFFFFKTISNR